MKIIEKIKSYRQKTKQKRIEKKQKRIKKILSKILGVSLLVGVLLSLFIFPSSAETASMYEQFPVVPEGVYEFADDQAGEDSPIVTPYADIFPVLVESTYYLDGINSELVFYDTDGIYYSFIPAYVTFYYEDMPDTSINSYCWRFAFYSANGSYVEIYTFDTISLDIPGSISEATWYCGYVGKSDAVTVYKSVDYCKLILEDSITDARLVDLFLAFSDFDYNLNGRVAVNSFRNNTSFEIEQELYNVDILYRGGQYSGPFELTYPYYTSNGSLRLLARTGSPTDTTLFIDDNYGFTFEFHDVSIKSIPKLFCLLHVWDVEFNSQLSYFVKGELYSNSIVVPEGLYAKLNFTSNGEQFNYISSGVYNYANGEIERYIRYDNKQVYTERYDSNTGVTLEQFWADLDYKLIDCGEDYQFITYKLYQFLNTNFSDVNDPNALESAFNSGYESGIQAGYSIGFEEGTQIGYENGYDKGIEDGYNQGYQKGYNDGYNLGASSGSSQGDEFMGNFFSGIVDALDSLKLFGEFSVYDMIITIIGAFVLVFILRLVAGG